MESGLPALIIAAIFMVSTVLVARGGFQGADAIGESLRQSEARYGQQNRTGLVFVSSAIDNTGTNLTIRMRNDGQTSIADFGRMDVVVQYFGETGARYDKWLPFTAGALASDTWKTGAFTNDVFEPGILNTGESVELQLRLNPAVGVGTSNLAVIGTEKGVTVQTYFDGPP